MAVTLDSGLLEELDRLVAGQRFPSRSQAGEAAVADQLARLAHTRLAHEVAKLDAREEKALAEEGMGLERGVWPAY